MRFFEEAGVSVEAMLHDMRRLFDRRLIETLDPYAKLLGVADKCPLGEVSQEDTNRCRVLGSSFNYRQAHRALGETSPATGDFLVAVPVRCSS